MSLKSFHAGALLGMLAATPAMAEIRLDRGALAIVGNAGVVATGALADDPLRDDGIRDHGDLDAYGSLNAEVTLESGLLLGGFISRDTASNRPDTLKNDRLFGYAAGTWGRVEIGRTSGPARRMSFYAPVLGSGQVRGDFARYAGASALLWAFDSRQAFKIAYLSPPIGGFRFGASWAPKVNRFDTRQNDVFELGAQYEAPVGAWVLGASAGYVHGNADTPGLHDINSWSLGAQARSGNLVIGGAYVERGDSNRFGPGFGQNEVNLGVAWRTPKWSAALSAARTHARGFDNDLVGLGGVLPIGEHVSVTADIVAMRQRQPFDGWRGGAVLLAGLDVHL